MPNGHYPLLIFPGRAEAVRSTRPSRGGGTHKPGADQQRQRIAPQLAVLQQAFEARRIRLQQHAPLENPELVLVLEVVGSVDNFSRAVNRVPGLEWLAEIAEDQIEPDDNFYDEQEPGKLLSGRLYLLGTNQEALDQLLGLWQRYQQDPAGRMDHGLAPFKHVFEQLRDIRPWDVRDRVDADMRMYWEDHVQLGEPSIRFEIEAWYFTAAAKNERARNDVERLVQALGGRVLDSTTVAEIAYHGLLVELPADAIRSILDGDVPELLLSERIMFFRPQAQSIADGVGDAEPAEAIEAPVAPERPPVVALLDGLPLGNHALLANRLIIDDPDGWEAGYEAKDRVHGTAMASLILHGSLGGVQAPLNRKLYVRPIMRPDPNDNRGNRRIEHTPDNVLLIDLIHRAVKRMCAGEAGQAPTAPTVRVVNLSMGDSHRIFDRQLSPWARLLDWLAQKYRLLFIVSAGNDSSPLTLATPRDSLAGLAVLERQRLALSALLETGTRRRLMSPAESINALTVGALHADDVVAPNVPNRFDLFSMGGVSPLSRIGLGFRRAIKPDILMPGGRTLYAEKLMCPPAQSDVELVNAIQHIGHRAAIPPLPGEGLATTAYSRGTSNAAALASRAAAQAFEIIEDLRAGNPNAPSEQYDAVLLKSLLVHGAAWGDLSSTLLAMRPDIQNHIQKKDFLARWLGHGAVDPQRGTTCTAQRATLLGVGDLAKDQALVFSAPLPPSLAGRREWRRVTITLAWMSPINPAHQAYRRAKLSIARPVPELRVDRENSVDHNAALRGTVQHEIFEGHDALAFVDGDKFEIKVNCAAEAGDLIDAVPFALCVSLEVAIDSEVPVYEEIRERISPPVEIRPGG